MMVNPADAIKDDMWAHLWTGSQRACPEIMEVIADALQNRVNCSQGPYRCEDDVYRGRFQQLVVHAAIELVALVLDPRWEQVRRVLDD